MCWLVLGAVLPIWVGPAVQEQVGSIRGVVFDADFDVPLAAATVKNVETGQEVTTADQGDFVFGQVPAGQYTLVFSKDGYVRQVRTNVVVSVGQLTEVSASLAGDFTDMEEFVVQDVLLMGAGTEAALLQLRLESPSFMDSIGSDLMNQAGASDAASALRLVAGASLQDGKSAVIRGLPDRYVSNQLNGVRLPSADPDKRAVELDQFPSAVIESIQVSKTFTPDQQGDASGGAVDVRLKGIPAQSTLDVKGQLSVNNQVGAAGSDFLTYEGGGFDYWGRDDGSRDIQTDRIGANWDGAVGTSTGEAPTDYKWSLAGGHKHRFKNDVKIGGYGNFFYERDSSFFDDGINDSYWVVSPGDPLTPQTIQGSPEDGSFKTSLFDVTQGRQSVQWGGLGTFGVETDDHFVGLTYLYTQTTDDTATLATDTRGKEYFFPGYDPDDITSEGNQPNNLEAAPYLRTETLEFTERATGSVMLNGRHRLPVARERRDDVFKAPEIDWVVAESFATLDQPDKRQFGAYWVPVSLNPGAPPFLPPFKTPATWFPFKPAANFNLGNFQRIYQTVDEQSDQYALNLKLPFEQWTKDLGYLKFGIFDDDLEREFTQDSFSNFGDAGANYQGGWDDPWSQHFNGPSTDFISPENSHPITESLFDVDYDGTQRITAYYAMMDLPLNSDVRVIGGGRAESTKLTVQNQPEELAQWFPPGSTAPVTLNPGDADVDFAEDEILPSIGLAYEPVDNVTLRASYGQTIARQTFKELTPIIQQEFLGGPIFIGNPDLGTSSLENYDLRVDYSPSVGSLLSGSWFLKDITDPIEYVQRLAGFTFTTPVNYPKGELSGFELELRQDLGKWWETLRNTSIGANATWISSEVTLSEADIAEFANPAIDVPITSREATNAPAYIYNFYVTYEIPKTGTQFAVFYTLQGDTLVAGAGVADGNFVPSVYATAFDTLNVSLTQRLGRYLRLQIQGKNLTNPALETVYRSEAGGEDLLRTSFTAGFEVAVSLSASFSF